MSLSTTSYVLSRRFGNQIRKLIMISIADYTGDDTGTAWAFIDTLAARAECSRRSVQEHLEILERDGELEIYRNAGPKGSHRFKILKRFDQPEPPQKRGAAFAPHPEFRGAGFARGVQMAYVEQHERGADERRPFAPKTIEQKNNKKERESANAPRSLATSFELEEYAHLIARLNHCRPGWEAAPVMNAKEIAALKANLPCLNAILPETWLVLKDYLAATMAEGSPAYQPRSRERFISAISDVVAYAVQWDRKRPKKAIPVPKATQPENEDPPLSIAEILAILKMKP